MHLEGSRILKPEECQTASFSGELGSRRIWPPGAHASNDSSHLEPSAETGHDLKGPQPRPGASALGPCEPQVYIPHTLLVVTVPVYPMSPKVQLGDKGLESGDNPFLMGAPHTQPGCLPKLQRVLYYLNPDPGKPGPVHPSFWAPRKLHASQILVRCRGEWL